MAKPRSTQSLVTGIGFVPASREDVRTGLIGFVTCVFAGTLLLDGIALRLTAERRPTLSFPSKIDRWGYKRTFFRPVDDSARRAIEAAVFTALGIDPEVQL